VLKTDPDWSLLAPDTPPRIRELLRRCLTRDPHERLRDMGDARISIEEARGEPTQVAAVRTRSGRWVAPVCALAGVGVGILLARVPPTRSSAGPGHDWFPKRLSLALPPGFQIDDVVNGNNALAISPDARRVVLGGGLGLVLRDLDQLAPIHLLDDASDPFFSPDGQWLGFFRKARLWKHRFTGANPR